MTQKLTLPTGVTINYEESGNPTGSPILLMHGWGCNHTTLASIEKILASGMRVINVDLPGFGDSPEPPAVWGVEDYTQAMEQFLDCLGIDRPSLLGHSFGGRVCILMGSRRTINKIVLVDAAGVKPRHSLSWYLKVYSYKLAKRLYPLILGKRKAQERIDAARRKRSSADYEQASPRMRAILSKCVNEDLCAVMPAISAPTLLVWGTADTATPLADAKKMEKLIPDAGLVAFDGCGHYSFLDNPGGFRAVISSFFKNELTPSAD